MAHLVSDHGGEFRLVVRQRNEAASHVKLAGRQRKRIDRLGIEHRDPVMQVGPVGGRHQPLGHLLDHRLQARVVIDPAIRRQDPLVLTQFGRRHLGLGRLRRRRLDGRLRRRGRGGHGRTFRQEQRRQNGGHAGKPAARYSCWSHSPHTATRISSGRPSQSAPDTPPRSKERARGYHLRRRAPRPIPGP